MAVTSRGLPDDSGPRLLREIWALTALSILIVTLRVIAKIRIQKFACDDILMTLALVSLPLNRKRQEYGNLITLSY